MAKRCICGRSQRQPLCDGSHASLGWTCAGETIARVAYAFVAGRHNENLAERLASELQGLAVHTVTATVHATRLVVIADPATLDEVRELCSRVEASGRRIIAIDLAPGLAAAIFDDAEIVTAAGEDPLALWRSVLESVTCPPQSPPRPRTLTPAFVSHAVADEPQILPTLTYLRRHAGADLFVCADSIDAGARWHDAIVGELRRRPILVWLLSKRSVASTFCSFEIGFATATEKRVIIVSLDGERPPSFAQHLHAIDLDRRRAARPWLDPHEALADALCDVLSTE